MLILTLTQIHISSVETRAHEDTQLVLWHLSGLKNICKQVFVLQPLKIIIIILRTTVCDCV